jgi:hypothetical protein
MEVSTEENEEAGEGGYINNDDVGNNSDSDGSGRNGVAVAV